MGYTFKISELNLKHIKKKICVLVKGRKNKMSTQQRIIYIYLIIFKFKRSYIALYDSLMIC